MTRFVAAQLARDHYFDITAAKTNLGYQPRISMSDVSPKFLLANNSPSLTRLKSPIV